MPTRRGGVDRQGSKQGDAKTTTVGASHSRRAADVRVAIPKSLMGSNPQKSERNEKSARSALPKAPSQAQPGRGFSNETVLDTVVKGYDNLKIGGSPLRETQNSAPIEDQPTNSKRSIDPSRKAETELQIRATVMQPESFQRSGEVFGPATSAFHWQLPRWCWEYEPPHRQTDDASSENILNEVAKSLAQTTIPPDSAKAAAARLRHEVLSSYSTLTSEQPGRSTHNTPSRSGTLVKVWGLHMTITDEDLFERFAIAGVIVGWKLHKAPGGKLVTGDADIWYDTLAEAQEAVRIFDGSPKFGGFCGDRKPRVWLDRPAEGQENARI